MRRQRVSPGSKVAWSRGCNANRVSGHFSVTLHSSPTAPFCIQNATNFLLYCHGLPQYILTSSLVFHNCTWLPFRTTSWPTSGKKYQRHAEIYRDRERKGERETGRENTAYTGKAECYIPVLVCSFIYSPYNSVQTLANKTCFRLLTV